MNRKEFLKKVSAASFLMSTPIPQEPTSLRAMSESKTVNTVTGPIKAEKMGITLAHEHVMSTFGASPQEPGQYDKKELFNEVIPDLKSIKSLGCNTLVDCTAAYFGRNVSLLREISRKTGLQIITNTGIYGAVGDKYVPEYAYQESAERLADRWIEESKNGIQGTGIKPGFVKVGVDGGTLSDIDAKLVRAAAFTHLETGLLVQVHTSGNPLSAQQQMVIFKNEGVSPAAWVWVHAHNMKQTKPLLEAAGEGAWISLDGMGTADLSNGKAEASPVLQNHLQKLKAFKERNMLSHVLLSHDGDSYPVYMDHKRPYNILFNNFIPMLRQKGFSDEEINQLVVTNPAKAFSTKIQTI